MILYYTILYYINLVLSIMLYILLDELWLPQPYLLGDSKDTVSNIVLRGPDSKKQTHTHFLKPTISRIISNYL